MAEDVPRDEKTEEATPRRRQQTREKGNVPFSTELVAGTMLAAVALAIVVGGGSFAQECGRMVVRMLRLSGELALGELETSQAAGLASASARSILPALLAMLLPIFAVGAVVAYGQVGFQIAPKAVGFDPARIDPLKGLGRMFSLRSFVRLLQAAAKIGLISTAMGAAVWSDLPRLDALVATDLRTMLLAAGWIVAKSAGAALAAILLIALIDVLWQRRQHETEIRMTKREVKEEFREVEGDPHVRARIRGIQREMARRRMMAEVPKATVVVTNPTHYAVALRYDREGEDGRASAPRVVAKGVDRVAESIKRVAREAGVPCYEAPPLARALHAQVEIGQEIPEQLFQAVAGVLAYVYRLQQEPVPA